MEERSSRVVGGIQYNQSPRSVKADADALNRYRETKCLINQSRAQTGARMATTAADGHDLVDISRSS